MLHCDAAQLQLADMHKLHDKKNSSRLPRLPRLPCVCPGRHQVQDVARIAAEDVARLQGQLADLDHKNRMQASAAITMAIQGCKQGSSAAWSE